jgi:hypothetical protein
MARVMSVGFVRVEAVDTRGAVIRRRRWPPWISVSSQARRAAVPCQRHPRTRDWGFSLRSVSSPWSDDLSAARQIFDVVGFREHP